MAKRSQRRRMQYEKDQSGCIWGLISIFDFRNSRSNRKLLSDRRRGSKHVVGAGFSRGKLDHLTDFDEKCQGTDTDKGSTTVTADVGKPSSVKKLIEEEMYSEQQDPKKQICNAEVEAKQSDSGRGGQVRKNRKKTDKTCKKTCNVHIHDLNAAENLGSDSSCRQNSEQQLTSNLDINAIMEELCSQIHQNNSTVVKHDQHEELCMQPKQQFSVSEEKLSEATKVFINQKFMNGKHLTTDEKIHHSKEFLDALQTLNSNKELFLKLLQDPNSLLVKHVQSLLDSQVEKVEKSKSFAGSGEELSNSKPFEELVNRKQHNFFRRKIKSHGRNPSGNESDKKDLNRIVILKPGPADLQNSKIETGLSSAVQSHYIMRNKGLSDRTASQFSLTEIKRKFKHAVGKDRRGISADDSLSRFSCDHHNLGDGNIEIGGEHVGRNSSNKNHFFTERFAKPSIGIKKGDKTGMPKDSVGHPEQRLSSIYIEAKKHLSEMLSNGDEGEEFLSRQVPKSLGRILSLPEYNFSPVSSPGRDWEHGFVTAQTRFSACEKFKVNENAWPFKQENSGFLVPSTQNLGTQSSLSDDNPDNKAEAPSSTPNISDEHIHDNEAERTLCSVGDEMSSEVDVETVKTTNSIFQEESNVLDASSEPSSSYLIINEQNSEIAEICDEKGSSECLKLDLTEENQLSSSPLASPSSSSIAKNVECLESAIDRPERPSPISVLEPLFAEDDISPARTIARPGGLSYKFELPMQPLQIQFEEQDSSASDQGIHVKTSMGDRESIFEYIKAVLQTSGVSWDEFFIRSLSSDQLLDSSLIHEVELFSNQLCHDHKLLFDCINEVLMEVFEHYFGSSPWVSFVKPSIRPIPEAKNVIYEVWEGVNWHLLPVLSPLTLEHIVRKDMAKSGTWMDLRSDAESIGMEMGEAIMEELIEDTILSCVNERPAIGVPALSAELTENESSINL